ncbi:MAG: triosephosphate isomerase [Flavobacteriales bacterium]|jgi:triosephosphate isomerase|tara:strand:+ start:4406 stop:5152 length:747 start_codon:yes stop_codon:yes gene_type:complete
MRKEIVAGNWKMNMSLQDGLDLCRSIILQIQNSSREVIVAVPYTHLAVLRELCKNSNLKIAAQNCHHEITGAYTGEVSAAMLADLGVNYVLVGHSERRAYNAETNDLLAKKVDAALFQNLQVIYCFGETLEERSSNSHFSLITKQITEGVFHLDETQVKNIVLAYEPVWAIGTGETATRDQAQEMHAHIRTVLSDKYGEEIAQNCSILYGGSCKPTNATELFSQPDVDGGLIGGASLNAADFVSIIKA